MSDRIMIVEDDEATRYAYERALTAAGYRTKGYADYFAAADDIDRGLDGLLIVDLGLPPGTPQGVSVARMAQFRRPGLPIIFVTGHPELADVLPDDLGPVFLKPVDMDNLVHHVRRYVLPETDQPG